ncbi:MAG: mevalonate kinase [Chloroflexota bacterium]|nr:MAG: mevalonate kinase [Bellilinea sp.]
MPAVSASAPGKVILFGEHAVVYGQPAIAAPVTGVAVKVIVQPNLLQPPGSIEIDSPAVDFHATRSELPEQHPLNILFHQIEQTLHIARLPAMKIRINSTLPAGAGMGSSAAVSVAMIRAITRFIGLPLNNEQVNQIAFEVEKAFHGTPSGIDNTVITYQMPIYFIKNYQPRLIHLKEPITLVIANAGEAPSTAEMVAGVRQRWQQFPQRYEQIFRQIGRVVEAALQILENGNWQQLPPLMRENHQLLQEIGVSSPSLDKLVSAALQCGAYGAKLTGGGGGGNIIALVQPEQADSIAQKLREEGALHTWLTTLHPSENG